MILRKQLVAAGLAALVAGGTVIALPSQTAQAQADQYERVLAGIRLNSKATSVLRAYGNPNDVVVGDVGIREAPGGGQGGTQAGAGGGLGAPGGGGLGVAGGMSPGGGGAMGGPGGMRPGGGGPPAGYGGSGGPPAGYGGSGGPPAGYGGPGGPPGGFGGAGEDGGRGGGFPGGGFPGAGGGGFPGAGGGSSTGQFGQTVSNLTPQQETTWIYNRKAGRDVVSYEFLVGQGGAVTQIRTIGYSGGNIKTKKGVRLGTSYKDVVLRYGVPEEQFRVGRSLIASYKRKNHVLFQFLNQRGQQENPYSAGNKVIAITIASVE